MIAIDAISLRSEIERLKLNRRIYSQLGKKYIHRDGPFEGKSAGAEYAILNEEGRIVMVWPDGKELVTQSGVDSLEEFIDRGWWIPKPLTLEDIQI